MAVFVARPLDVHEVRVLSVLEQFTDPISVTKILKRVDKQSQPPNPYWAIRRLEAFGYVVRAPKPGHIRYYQIPAEHRPAIRCQLTLGGRIDDFPLTTWVLAAMWHSDARDQATAISPGWVYTQLIDWQKYEDGGAVRAALESLVKPGYLTRASRGNGLLYFYATPHQREKIRGKIPQFPLIPGCFPPADSPEDDEARRHAAFEVYAWLAGVGRPIKFSEALDHSGAGVRPLLDRLIEDGKVARIAADGAPWGPDDVVYIVRPPAVVQVYQIPEPDPPLTPDTVSAPGYGDIPVFRLTPDEYTVLRFLIKRKVCTNPFFVSKQCFGDTTYSQPPWDRGDDMYTIPLRALPALRGLARKGLIQGDSTYEAGVAVPCKHDHRSVYRMTPLLKGRAVYSLDHTAEKEHCVHCGDIKEDNELMLCARCVAVKQATLRPLPGVNPVIEEDLKVLHAVVAFLYADLRPTNAAIAAFVFHPDAGFDAAKAWLLRRWYNGAAHIQTRRALRRLEHDGYVVRAGSCYRLTARQRKWVTDHYLPDRWPHLAAQTRDAGAIPAPLRSGRAVELD